MNLPPLPLPSFGCMAAPLTPVRFELPEPRVVRPLAPLAPLAPVATSAGNASIAPGGPRILRTDGDASQGMVQVLTSGCVDQHLMNEVYAAFKARGVDLVGYSGLMPSRGTMHLFPASDSGGFIYRWRC